MIIPLVPALILYGLLKLFEPKKEKRPSKPKNPKPTGFAYETTKRVRQCSVCEKSIKGGSNILVYNFKYEYIPRFYYSAVREKTFNFCKNCAKNASREFFAGIALSFFVHR